jgi:hypothetical protein
MFGLFCFVLAVLASPFKSKSRLEAENAALPTSVDHFAAQGAGPCPADEQRSLVLDPAISMAPVDSAGHHDRQT